MLRCLVSVPVPVMGPQCWARCVGTAHHAVCTGPNRPLCKLPQWAATPTLAFLLCPSSCSPPHLSPYLALSCLPLGAQQALTWPGWPVLLSLWRDALGCASTAPQPGLASNLLTAARLCQRDWGLFPRAPHWG